MILVLCMVSTLITKDSYAAEITGDNITYEANDSYTYIVSVKTGKAIQVSGGNTAAVTADAVILEGKGNSLPDKALFQMRRNPSNPNHVSFSSKGNGWRMLKSENINGEDIIDCNNALKTEVSGWEGYLLLDQGNGIVAIKDGRLNKLLTVADDNRVMVAGEQVTGSAEQFQIIEAKYPPEEDVNAEVYFIHKGTGKLVSVDGVVNNGIEVSLDSSGSQIPENAKFITYYGSYNGAPVINFESKQYNTMWKSDGSNVFQIRRQTPGGWESVTMVPLGDGTVAFKNNQNNKYISVRDGRLVTPFEGPLTDNEKFIVVTETTPKKVSGITTVGVEGSCLTLQWSPVTNTIFTGYEVWRSTTSGGPYVKVGAETSETSFTDTGLDFNTSYYYTIRTVNGSSPYAVSREHVATTLQGNRPPIPSNLDLLAEGSNIYLSWASEPTATSYLIYRTPSRFGSYQLIGNSDTASFTDTAPNPDKYANYYKIVASNINGNSNFSEPISLELKLFGENMIFFAPTDDIAGIDAEVARVYQIQKDAQFGLDRYALLFKPGDYTGTAMMQIGFYTQIAGLGKTPLETKIKNIETPAYLPDNNATCNFWRSGENLSIIDTDNNGDVYFNFKWAVSQAAPLRRMDVGRRSTFDWWYGWASGGFAADSVFHKEAGSYSQQQYYTRNSVLENGFYGVNWNGVFQGVTGAPATNWELGQGNNNYTNIATTPIIREKPFLYLDNGEYKVFVPGLRSEASGVSWSVDNMGPGASLSLDTFYIAKEGIDTAATINGALAAGKHILLTPGIYYAEEPIRVSNPNTIILGYGLATIVPTNQTGAMIIDDVDGVTVAGIIFDAGAYSKQLLLVGPKNSSSDHSANPTLLADLFFRIGGTTGDVATADVALVINSDDVIGDHFWIWRADHGAGVGWDLNKAKNGLIVNGDDMTMYALFNEHYQEYQTLWKGNGGRLYFYQSETPYDPQSQEEYMSHEGTTKGYASYKVANQVDTHYAVGLGIYDVFIHTNGASIFLDNAIEVPNKEGVIIENACIVEIANGSGPLVGINSIVNGTGNSISTGVGGKGFAREFILKYQNGIATLMNGTQEGVQPPDDPVTEEPGEEPGENPDENPNNPGTQVPPAPLPTPTPAPEIAKEAIYMPGLDAYAHLTWTVGATGTVKVTVELPVDELMKKLAEGENLSTVLNLDSNQLALLLGMEEVDGLEFEIQLPSDLSEKEEFLLKGLVLKKYILKAAKAAGKKLTVLVSDEKGGVRYSWTFAGDDLKGSNQRMKDVNLALQVSNISDNPILAAYLQTLGYQNRPNSLILHFEHKGILPAQANVRIYVGHLDIKAGERLYLYYYNSSSGKLETLPYNSYQIDEEGYLEISLLHCSDYALLPRGTKPGLISYLVDQIKVSPTKATLIYGNSSRDTASIKITLPVTLELVDDLGQETTFDAMGAVSVEYQSGNEGVAKVSSDGTITATGIGTAEITTSFTLYHGKVKKVITKVTVK